MHLNLENKRVLVTASSNGIGLAIATSLAKEGAEVIINGRSTNSVEQAITRIRAEYADAKLLPLVADNAVASGVEKTIATYPEVDVLINNLGIYEAVEFTQSTDEQWHTLLETNIMSGVRLSRHYLKHMLAEAEVLNTQTQHSLSSSEASSQHASNHKKDKREQTAFGRIIFISSESAINPAPEMAHYSATKTMQLSIARSLAELTKGTAITVNSILPGSTRTDSVDTFVQDLFPELTPQEAERKFMLENRSTSLIQRLIDPKEVADATAFIASPLASAINGAAIRVDGGIVRSVF